MTGLIELVLEVVLGKGTVFVLLFAVDQLGTAQCMMTYLYVVWTSGKGKVNLASV